MFTLGTGASPGACCSLFIQPDVDSFSIGDTGSIVSTITVPANWSNASSQSAISSQYQMIRPVSAGIRVEYVGNTQTDQGVIVVGQVANGKAPSNFNGTNLGSATAQFLSYKTFPLRAGAQITWRPESLDDQNTWVGCGAAGSGTSVAVNRPYLVVAVFGASSATTSLIQCEAVVNFEGQFKLQTFVPGGIGSINRLATPAATGWFEKARNIYNKVEPYLPLVIQMMSNSGNLPLMAMGNGMRYLTTTAKQKRII